LHSHRVATEILAEHPWPRLYDPDWLGGHEVPVAATIYVNGLYVERRFAEETGVAMRGLRPWISNEYEHNGLRADGERILGRLVDQVRSRVCLTPTRAWIPLRLPARWQSMAEIRCEK
jgi:hypothetical protein